MWSSTRVSSLLQTGTGCLLGFPVFSFNHFALNADQFPRSCLWNSGNDMMLPQACFTARMVLSEWWFPTNIHFVPRLRMTNLVLAHWRTFSYMYPTWILANLYDLIFFTHNAFLKLGFVESLGYIVVVRWSASPIRAVHLSSFFRIMLGLLVAPLMNVFHTWSLTIGEPPLDRIMVEPHISVFHKWLNGALVFFLFFFKSFFK